MLYVLIKKGKDGRFVKVWEGDENPFPNCKNDKIADEIEKKFGNGYFRLFRPQHVGHRGMPFGSTTIFSGFV